MSAAITFKRNGAIMRDGIRVGWIEDKGKAGGRFALRWYLRFTPAAGGAVPAVNYCGTLREAKIIAREALS